MSPNLRICARSWALSGQRRQSLPRRPQTPYGHDAAVSVPSFGQQTVVGYTRQHWL